MSERDDQSIDDELSGIAMAATHEHEQTVSGTEAQAALNAVRSRIAAGDLGGAPPSIPLSSSVVRRRSPWVRFGAVAAVVAMVALGLVAVIGGGEADDILVPATIPETPSPVTAPEPSVETTTAAPPTSAEAGIDPAVTTESESFERQTIEVDAADPPQLIEPTPFASVPVQPNDGDPGVSVAIGPDNILVKQKGDSFVSLIGPPDGQARSIDIGEDVFSMASGPGPVIYGLGGPIFDDGEAPEALRFVAVPWLGDRAGEVVAVSELPINEYLELPDAVFGHGPGGIVDRDRLVGTTVMEYVDENGDPLDWDESFPFPVFADGDGFGDRDRDVIELRDSEVSWQLEISRDPNHAGSFVGPNPPAPTTGDRVIYSERIGADLAPDSDFGPSALPVIALLNPDGSGSWVSLPDDWDVVASDVWGTVLMRRTASELEFALLDEALAAAGFEVPVPSDPQADEDDQNEGDPTTTTTVSEPVNELTQPTALQRNCAGISIACTQLALTQAGRIVGFDQVDDTFRVYDADGTELQAEVELAETVVGLNPFFVAVGPDDVAYLVADDPGVTDPVGRVLAIPLVGSNAGSVVMEWTGRGRSGDSSLIARKSGLTVVPCCGGDGTRPTPDATIYRWVDRDGGTIESTAPSFDLNLGRDANSLTRIDTADDGSPIFAPLPLPTAYANPRDFPQVVATDDGAALAYDFVQTRSGGVEVFVDFGTDWPRTNVENGSVYYRQVGDSVGVGLLEPTGTVIVAEGQNIGQWVRRSLGEVATRGWPGRIESEVGSDAITAPGLNDLIDDDQPFWAADPELFAWQLVPSLRDVESNVVELDGSDAPMITITSTGLLGDSVTATRLVVTTSRGDDGLLRFVSAVSSFQCEPGRGHQDFSTEFCT